MVDTSPLPEENKNKSNCKGYAHAFKKKKRKVPYEDICSWECTFPTQNPNPHSFPLSKILLHRKVLNEEVKFLGMYFFIPKLHPPFIPNLLRWQTDIAQLLVKLKENWNNASKVQRINTSCVSCVRLTLKTTASLENLLPKFAPPHFFFWQISESCSTPPFAIAWLLIDKYIVLIIWKKNYIPCLTHRTKLKFHLNLSTDWNRMSSCVFGRWLLTNDNISGVHWSTWNKSKNKFFRVKG